MIAAARPAWKAWKLAWSAWLALAQGEELSNRREERVALRGPLIGVPGHAHADALLQGGLPLDQHLGDPLGEVGRLREDLLEGGLVHDRDLAVLDRLDRGATRLSGHQRHLPEEFSRAEPRHLGDAAVGA